MLYGQPDRKISVFYAFPEVLIATRSLQETIDKLKEKRLAPITYPQVFTVSHRQRLTILPYYK